MTATPIKSIILLLVEDNQTLQAVLEGALKGEGFEVVLAGNGTEAITELDTDGARFKGLITDIRLGAGPNGWEVGHRAREVVSGIPVIYTSGDSAHEWSANGVPESVMLQKPFVMAQLITAITTLLNQAGNATALSCQSASESDPGSACNIDPMRGY
ncbi:DNA-binding response OmpR family regulator [Skermanella aerolata]|uniref:response regulator n=1 Tax=Skermanella aerolata TaxID=393310 RepID=UPI003D206A1B